MTWRRVPVSKTANNHTRTLKGCVVGAQKAGYKSMETICPPPTTVANAGKARLFPGAMRTRPAVKLSNSKTKEVMSKKA